LSRLPNATRWNEMLTLPKGEGSQWIAKSGNLDRFPLVGVGIVLLMTTICFLFAQFIKN
jgi:hypothetical protein